MLARTLTIAFVLAASVVSVAGADPAAEKLFEDGRTALEANQLDVACDAFRRSEALEPRSGTALNLGNCEERRKHIAGAWEAFVEAKGLAEREREGSSAKEADLRAKEADRRAKVLLPRLPYLLISVTRTDGLQLARDGVTVPEAMWDHELPIDANTYTLTATAPHHITWTKQVTLVEAQHFRVEVPALALEPTTETVTTSQPDVAAQPPPPPAVTVEATPPPKPATFHIGAGVFSGVSSDTSWYLGARVIWNALQLGPGTLRLVPRFQYTSTDPNDPYHDLKIWGFGGTIEYAYQPMPRLLLAGGVGFGVDHLHDGYQMGPGNPDGAVNYQTALARIAPALVLDRFAIEFAYELERGGNSFHHLFTLGLDCFVW